LVVHTAVSLHKGNAVESIKFYINIIDKQLTIFFVLLFNFAYKKCAAGVSVLTVYIIFVSHSFFFVFFFKPSLSYLLAILAADVVFPFFKDNMRISRNLDSFDNVSAIVWFYCTMHS